MADGPLCAAHPEAGVATCPHCGTFVCDQCVTRYPWGGFACVQCAQRNRARFPLSWQQRFSLRGWWQVFTAVLLQPRALFSHFPELGLGRAFAFASVALVANALVSVAMGRASEVATIVVTPCTAGAVYLVLRMATQQVQYRTVLAALWSLDGVYHLLLLPIAFTDPATMSGGPLALVMGLLFTYLALNVRALWFLARRRLGVGAGTALLAASAWALISISCAATITAWLTDDSSATLYGPAGMAPEP